MSFTERVRQELESQKYFTSFSKTDNIFNQIQRGEISDRLIRDASHHKALLAYIFDSVGYMQDPERDYNMEFVCRELSLADDIQRILLQHGIHARQTRRRGQVVVYLRDADAIADALTLMGATMSLLEFENARVVRSVRGNINRKVNCETANIDKTVAAAGRQIEDIWLLMHSERYEELPATLQEMARIRVEHPEASLQELGEMMTPPIGKSGVNHRLRRIQAEAEHLRQEHTLQN